MPPEVIRIEIMPIIKISELPVGGICFNKVRSGVGVGVGVALGVGVEVGTIVGGTIASLVVVDVGEIFEVGLFEGEGSIS